MPEPALLDVVGLRKTYGPLVALAGLDLSVAPGECVALLGHNGSGKTTALRCIAGQLEADAGTVMVGGVDARDVDRNHAARAALAFVGDAPIFYRDLTVAEHLELVALAHGAPSDAEAREALLAEVGLADKGDLLPDELSSGMAQKAQLACAYARPFRLLVLDEPALRLDPASQRALRERLLAVTAAGHGVLVTTHHLEFARGVAHRAVVLADGEIALQGPYEAVVDDEDTARLGLR